jgi:elongation factor Ts
MAEITARAVGALREKTGAGMMECKKALTECNGNIDEAVTHLRKKGIAKAESKAGREAREGVIASYIHLQGKVGVLVEVNCETDFVAKNEQFREFVKDVTLHIAAANPKYVSRDQVPAQVIADEREFATAQIKDKPPQVVEKIVQGKIDKTLASICLLEQVFIKDPDTTIEQLVKSMIARLGENIKIRRFTRYAVGDEAM